MCLLLESLKIFENNIFNIKYHNLRMNRSRKELFDSKDLLDLKDHVIPPPESGQYVIKCRVLYDREIEKIEYKNYIKRSVKTLKAVYSDNILYEHKFADRSYIDSLFAERNGCDDILIIKEGMITDTSFSNIIFYDGERWISPARPLLKGTKLMQLEDEGKVYFENIRPDDLGRYQKAMLINAMIDFNEDNIIDIGNIIL
jgi:4-amino-4-deoxychorismate lyase